MKHKLRFAAPAACLVGLILLLFTAAMRFPALRPDGVQSVTQWQLDGRTVSLPLTLGHLAPRTPLTLSAQAQPGEYLYLKTVYAPLRVYANETLVFEYGQPGTYPGFLLDPPTKTALVPLPDSEDTLTLRM